MGSWSSLSLGLLPIVLCAALVGCSSPSEPSPADQLSRSQASAHVDFRFSEGDSIDAPRQEAFYDWVIPQLGVTPAQRLQYHKYRDRNHLQRSTGQSTNGYADPGTSTVHSIWTWDAHEAVHVYTALIGRPSDFFNEGIAVALSVDPLAQRFVSLWNNTPIDTIARQLLSAGTLPSVQAMAGTDAFRQVNDQVSYPVAGSFVSYLLREHGVPAMRTFFQASSRGDSLALIQMRFSSAFGLSLPEAEARWRVFLAGPEAI